MANSNNGPVSVSAPQTSLTTASGQQITFSTRYPFAKLDTTNPVSFQLITIFFNTEPPNPAAKNTSKQTLVYSFPHGYTYTPSSWFLLSTDSFQTVAGPEGGYILGDPSGAGVNLVNVPIVVDSQNVSIYINKFWGGGAASPPSIIGYFLAIRAYIFVEDLVGNSVPSQP